MAKTSPQKAYWDKMTPEERSAEMKRRIEKGAARRAGGGPTKGGTRGRNGKEDHSNHISYLLGRTEALIEHYADSAGLPRAALAHGVGELLRLKARG